jgi:predicted transcriptional regulator
LFINFPTLFYFVFPPCEMMSKTFLPAIRGVVIHRLRKQGIGQPTIAKLIGVTQAAVSQILRKDESKFVEALVEMGLEEEEIHLLADTLCRELSKTPLERPVYYTVSGAGFSLRAGSVHTTVGFIQN